MTTTPSEKGGADFPIDWGCRLIEQQPEFLRARRVLEVGGGDFSRAIALATAHPKKTFYTIDFRWDVTAQNNIARSVHLQNLSFIKLNALDRFFADGLFDFSFSIAVMEHVAELESFLDALFRILAPRGVYLFSQAPFWTCKTGHHFNHGDAQVRSILDGYQHLRFGPDGLRAFLKQRGDLPFDINECVRKIYQRPDLSRLSPRETRNIIAASRFVIEGWDEKPDDEFDEASALLAVKAHGARYTLDDLRTHSVVGKLLKP